MKNNTDIYINRELSWIEFNKRVLLTGMEKEYKILDKVKFCSIFSNNLDEFLMVRVASLKAQVEAGVAKKSVDGLTPKEQLTRINKEVKKLNVDKQGSILSNLQGLQSLGGVLGIAMAGKVYDSFGPKSPFIAGSVILLFMIYLIAEGKNNNSSKMQTPKLI